MRIAVLDIGGTSIKTGIWDGSRLTCEREYHTLALEGGEALMQRVIGILRGFGSFDAIGVATAGQVDTEEGRILYANPNLPGYTGMPVRRILEETFGVPVAVENDVNAAAIGELHFGAAAGTPDFLCLTYGTGVGGAIVLDGEVYHGVHYCGGYFGGILTHAGDETRETPRAPEGAPGSSVSPIEIASRCGETRETPRAPEGAPGSSVSPIEIASRCGETRETPRAPEGAPGSSVSPMEIASRYGETYESSASVSALVRRACEIDASLTDGRKIFDAFDRPGIQSVVDAWIDEVVYGLLSLAHIFDPSLIILGGGIMEQSYVIKEVRRRTTGALETGFREVMIEGAKLGNTAGLMGAVILATSRRTAFS